MDPRDAMGRAPDDGAAYLREIALFLAVHLGRRAGVLWPEHGHPLLRHAADPSVLTRLSAEISRHTGLLAYSAPGAEGAESDPQHVLVQQVAGGSTWLLPPSRGEIPRTACLRLYSGDVLYIPPAHRRVSVGTVRGSAWIVTVLHPVAAPFATPPEPKAEM
jgi:hypothetical protein